MVFEFKTKIYYIYKNSCYLRYFMIEFKYCFKAESCKRGYQIKHGLIRSVFDTHFDSMLSNNY